MRIYLLLAVVFGLSYSVALGFNATTLQLWLWTCALLAIPCYFMARAKAAPDKTEVALARAWTICRRIVCFTAAAIFGAAAVLAVVKGELAANWLGIGVLAALAGVFVWWGSFGAGNSRNYGEDRPMHEARKKRYGWK